MRRLAGAQVRDDLLLVLGTGQRGLPRREVLEAVEVAVRDDRQARLGDPREEVVPVDELEAVDDRRGPGGLAGEAGGAAPAALAGLGRVRGDQRGTGVACSRERLIDPIVDRHVLAQAHGDAVGALLRTVVVVGQLEPGNHEQVVRVERARGLGLDRRQVLAVVSGVDVIVRRAGLRRRGRSRRERRIRHSRRGRRARGATARRRSRWCGRGTRKGAYGGHRACLHLR